MTRGADRRARRSTTNSVGLASAATSARLRTACARRPAGAHARLPQADHDRRRARQRAVVRTSRKHELPGRRRQGDRAARRSVACCIGLGGGAASSVMAAGTSTPRTLDFASRAARQPRDAAARAGSHRPLLGAGRRQPDSSLVHDVGAGGLSATPVPEAGGRRIRSAVRSSTCERCRCRTTSRACRRWRLWCNESPGALRVGGQPPACVAAARGSCAARERCPVAVIGTLTG